MLGTPLALLAFIATLSHLVALFAIFVVGLFVPFFTHVLIFSFLVEVLFHFAAFVFLLNCVVFGERLCVHDVR